MKIVEHGPSRIRERLEEIAFYDETQLSKVAEYLLNSEEVSNVTVKELLVACNVTSPTPTRLAQKIGLSGFSELKVKLDIQNKEEANNKKNLMSEGLNTYKEQIFKTFDCIYESLNEEQLQKMSNDILTSRKVICISEGTHNSYLKEFCVKLNRLSIEAHCPVEEHEKFITIENAKDDDLLIFVSLSGTTQSTIKGLAHVLDRKSEKYMLTANNKFSMLDPDHIVYINTNESIRQISNINTRLAIISIFDIIYLNIIKHDFERNLERIKKTKLRKAYNR
ncbi:MurR/RpiR family transcriptional regulator [Mollicutes bacterium LVI A0039]|nr:MurR/RpiR family transcriptional regulator [Mollicutes bacterium LVI A0039]